MFFSHLLFSSTQIAISDLRTRLKVYPINKLELLDYDNSEDVADVLDEHINCEFVDKDVEATMG